ncbi:MAG: MFS transporter [Propionibacteriaceae bacterium]
MTGLTSTPTATVRAARAATYVIFGLNGLVFASWAARVPAVAEILRLDPGALGLLLLMTGLGSVIGLPLAGRIITRLGTAQTIRCAWAMIASALSVVAIALHQDQLLPTGAALFILGFAIGVWDVSQNIEGAEVERRLGYTIMPRFHAAFSGGAFVGALVGALFGRIGVSLSVHLAIIVVVGSVIAVVCARRFLPAGDAAHDVGASSDGAPARSGWLEPRTLVIGLVVLGAAFTEGSANDWLAKAAVDGLGASQAVGSALFAVFVLAMTAFRFAGSNLVDRLGRVTTVRICLTASLIGLVVFVFSPDLVVAAIGAVFWGVGAALGFPLGMSAAADDPVRAAARVSVVSTIGYGAFLLGPPVLGLLGDMVGVRRSLLLVGAVVVLSLLTVPAIRPPTTEAGGARR